MTDRKPKAVESINKDEFSRARLEQVEDSKFSRPVKADSRKQILEGKQAEGTSVKNLEKMPMVMRFPPESYTKVDPNRIAIWKKQIEARLGRKVDLGADFGATESFTRSSNEERSFRSDFDADRAFTGPVSPQEEKGANTMPWPSAPVILGFAPVSVERVRKAALPGWRKLLEEKLGVGSFSFGDLEGSETTSFCEEHPFGPGKGPKILYACDCDMDGGGGVAASGRR